MLGLGKDATVPVRTVFFLMLIFGSFQLLFLFEIFYSRSFIQNWPQCDCKCTKQLQISTGNEGVMDSNSIKQNREAEVRIKMPVKKQNIIKDEGEKLWQRIEDAEEAELDKELRAKSKNADEDGEPDENIHGEDEKIDPDDGSLEGEAQPAIPYHTELQLNPDIDDSAVRCQGNHSHIMLLYVYSAPGNFRDRKRVRRTWASTKNIGDDKELRVIFFIGNTHKKTKVHQPKLIEESKNHRDIVQDLSYIDSYRNLTMKGMSAMKWVRQHCPEPYKVVKVDDDTLVNPFALVKFLKGQTETNMKKLICKVTSYSKPYRNPASKYYVSKTEYPKDVYPPYCQGYGYIIPPEMIPELIAHLRDVTPITMEDVYFTGLVRTAASQQAHPLTALFSTVYSNFDKFLERIVARPELMFIGHVHTERFADLYWKLIKDRYDPNKIKEKDEK